MGPQFGVSAPVSHGRSLNRSSGDGNDRKTTLSFQKSYIHKVSKVGTGNLWGKKESQSRELALALRLNTSCNMGELNFCKLS